MKWLKIPEFGIEISEQTHNKKTYEEIKNLLKKGEKIADYPLLQKLRNMKKWQRFEDFWVFVPNPDKMSKENEYVSRFFAGSDWAGLDCSGGPSNRDDSLGCFIMRKIRDGKSKN